MRTHACCCWGYGICIAVLPQAEEEDTLGHEKLKSVSSPPQDCRGVACDKRTARTHSKPSCLNCMSSQAAAQRDRKGRETDRIISLFGCRGLERSAKCAIQYWPYS